MRYLTQYNEHKKQHNAHPSALHFHCLMQLPCILYILQRSPQHPQLLAPKLFTQHHLRDLMYVH